MAEHSFRLRPSRNRIAVVSVKISSLRSWLWQEMGMNAATGAFHW